MPPFILVRITPALSISMFIEAAKNLPDDEAFGLIEDEIKGFLSALGISPHEVLDLQFE
jgi:hypothetical protein